MTRLTRLFIDAATENVDALPRRLSELGLRYPKEREDELRAAIEELFYRYYGSSLSSIDPIEVIREGLDLIYSLNLRLPSRFVILDKAIATLGSVGHRALSGLQRLRGRAAVCAPAHGGAFLATADVAARPVGGARARRCGARAPLSAARRDRADASGQARDPDQKPGLRRPQLPHRPCREPHRGGADRPRRARRLVDRRRAREGRPSRHGPAPPLVRRVRDLRHLRASGSSGGSPAPGGCNVGWIRPGRLHSAKTSSCGTPRTRRPSRPVVSTEPAWLAAPTGRATRPRRRPTDRASARPQPPTHGPRARRRRGRVAA